MRVVRFLFFIVGIFILTLGVSLTIKAGLGAGAWDALSVGESKTFGLTVGKWVIINGIILLFVNAVLQKRGPEWLAIITFTLIGQFIDFWLYIVLGDISFSSLSIRFVILIVGMLLLSLGVASYLQANFPVNPIDNLMISLHKRFGLSIGVAKTIGEVFAFVLAFLLHGSIGVGTVIITLFIGPIIQWLNALLSGLYRKWSS
jgi:uncharacterized membrane protein YczE